MTKKSQTTVKKTQKCKLKRKKVTQTSEKRHKNVNLDEKSSQHSEKKPQKCKFRSEKVAT